MNTLTPSQQTALELLHQGNNVFVTGEAGSGKSYLIRQFTQDLDPKTFPILASTGAAAVLVGGRTFHSFMSLGILEGGVDKTVDRAINNRRVVKRLRELEGFVLDEVSMLSGETLAAAERICRLAREREEPWGGLRVVAVGDFAQLPPVERGRQGKPWAFMHPVWRWSQFRSVVLKQNQRIQDQSFLDVLNSVREGRVTEQVKDFLDERMTGSHDSPLQGTRLFPRRDATEAYNLERLEELPGEPQVFASMYSGSERAIQQLKKVSPLPESLMLKEGAWVMLRQNDPRQRWVNGSTGIITKIEPVQLSIELLSGRTVRVEPSSFSLMDAEGEVVATVSNFPVSLAYATTIHKAQGMTLDELHVDLSRLWEPGQAYVALSRVKTSGGVTVQSWNPRSIKADPLVSRFYAYLQGLERSSNSSNLGLAENQG